MVRKMMKKKKELSKEVKKTFAHYTSKVNVHMVCVESIVNMNTPKDANTTLPMAQNMVEDVEEEKSVGSSTPSYAKTV